MIQWARTMMISLWKGSGELDEKRPASARPRSQEIRKTGEQERTVSNGGSMRKLDCYLLESNAVRIR